MSSGLSSVMGGLPKGKWARRFTIGSFVMFPPLFIYSYHLEEELRVLKEERMLREDEAMEKERLRLLEEIKKNNPRAKQGIEAASQIGFATQIPLPGSGGKKD